MANIKDRIKIVEKSEDELADIKKNVILSGLSDSDIEVVFAGLDLILWLPKLLLEQKVTQSRLMELLFGKSQATQSKRQAHRSHNTNEKDDDKDNNDSAKTTCANDDEIDEGSSSQITNKQGRISQSNYNNAIEHVVSHTDLKAGLPCPLECGGRLYDFRPSVRVIIKGNTMGTVHRYTIEKLRCALCNEIFTPDLPNEINHGKYDAHFIAQLALQKYYLGMPSLRQETYQKLLEFPLPHTTQWMLNEKLASVLIPIFNELCKQAPNASLIHIDDTRVRIVDEIIDNRCNPDKKRKGMFTTGLMSIEQSKKICLFFNGSNHAGENLDAILTNRNNNEPLKVMSDALSRNASKLENVIKCYCLSHAFRKFEELIPFHEEQCLIITDFISDIYRIDHQTDQMNERDRLHYHQKHSIPILNKLYAYLNELIETKAVEPNDCLGKAINYTLKHWHELTQFSRVEGAPVDNNILERSLKVPIRGRTNWLFYKTNYGAYIGGVITSIIYTCVLSDINPLEYLIATQENKDQIVKEPGAWLPWNYQAQLNLDGEQAA